MPTDVLMPQMGESITEGTIVRWIKAVGDTVEKDEPLFEISTDKVDAEIPSPSAGVLVKIQVKEGDTVPINSIVGVIEDGVSGTQDAVEASPAAAAAELSAASGSGSALGAAATPEAEGGRVRTSPLVRRLAEQHGVDLSAVKGSGTGGRVTKEDVEAFVAAREAGGSAAPAASAPATGERVRVEKMSVMRRKIAEHMVASMRTSPHVYIGYEVDMGRVAEVRAAHRAAYEADGARLTYTAFITRAAIDTIREFPIVNASLDGENIVYREDINIGMAVALEQGGLIVPVVRNADTLDMRALCRGIQDLADRARGKRLNPDDVQGGTFTITNPGVFGAVFGLPLLNQPQVAILAVGAIEKRAVVVDDEIVIRPTCWLTLGFDHRLMDGADAGRFLLRLKERLEQFDESAV